MKRIPIVLTKEQRLTLEQFAKAGVHNARLVKRAKIMLWLDTSEGQVAMKQEEIAKSVGVSRKVVNDAKRDFLAAESVEKFLQRKKRATPPRMIKVTGEIEARIIAIACSEAPQGRARWTTQLIADQCVALHYIDSLSHMTVYRVLKKHHISLT